MQEVTPSPVPTASCLVLSTRIRTDVPEDCPAKDSHDKTNKRIAHAIMRTNKRIPRRCSPDDQTRSRDQYVIERHLGGLISKQRIEDRDSGIDVRKTRRNAHCFRTCCHHILALPSGERRTRPSFRQYKLAAELEED